jgi:hypothetical protein
MSFTLKYPATGSIQSSVTLRNPELGDIERVNAEGIVRRTRAGTLLGVRDNDWPQTQTNVYNFSTLKAADKNSLITFLQDYAGLEIGIVDHLNQSWQGIISSAENEIVTVKDDCSYDVSFEFIGSKI